MPDCMHSKSLHSHDQAQPLDIKFSACPKVRDPFSENLKSINVMGKILNVCKTIEFELKWVPMAQYGLISKQGEPITLWLRIISKRLPTLKTTIRGAKYVPKQEQMCDLCQENMTTDPSHFKVD